MALTGVKGELNQAKLRATFLLNNTHPSYGVLNKHLCIEVVWTTIASIWVGTLRG